MLSFAATLWCMLTLWILPHRGSGLGQFSSWKVEINPETEPIQTLSLHLRLFLFQNPFPSSLLHTLRQPEHPEALAFYLCQGRNFLSSHPPMRCGCDSALTLTGGHCCPGLDLPLNSASWSRALRWSPLHFTWAYSDWVLGLLNVSPWLLYIRSRTLEIFVQHSLASCVHFLRCYLCSRGLRCRVLTPWVLV